MGQAVHKKKIAAIITQYRYNSHAEVIIGRLLGDFDAPNFSPRVEVVSMYIDQFKDNDMSREVSKKTGVPIFSTVAEAIQVGDSSITINGVIIIGEHGDYPWNEKRQKMYPRRRLMEETLQALDALDLSVPIFSDKHLAYDMRDAAWIYRQLKQRNLPFMGGSSVPLTGSEPGFDPKALETAKEWFVISFDGIEVYGFHAMEVLQHLAEKRNGGETGVATVRGLEGEEVWEAMDRNEWPEDLLLEALTKQPNHTSLGHPREQVEAPVIFIVEYLDGSKGYVLQLPEFVNKFTFAVRNELEIISSRCNMYPRPFKHFEILTKMVEDVIINRKESFPMERTYVTTGLINLGMESLHQKKVIETPELWITYHVHS